MWRVNQSKVCSFNQVLAHSHSFKLIIFLEDCVVAMIGHYKQPCLDDGLVPVSYRMITGSFNVQMSLSISKMCFNKTLQSTYELLHEKAKNLHMRKQRCRSAVQ